MTQEFSLMTIEQVAQFLQLQPESVRTMARQGRIPALRAGRVRRFDRKQSELRLAEQSTQTEEAEACNAGQGEGQGR